MGEKWLHCHGNKFSEISTKEIKLRDFKCNFLKKTLFSRNQQEKTTNAMQPMN